jgi:hypothetical protein
MGEMSDTPKLADECKKLLDNGHIVVLYGNKLGSYTAIAMEDDSDARRCVSEGISKVADQGPHITDDFEPSQALYRLTEKMYGNIV